MYTLWVQNGELLYNSEGVIACEQCPCEPVELFCGCCEQQASTTLKAILPNSFIDNLIPGLAAILNNANIFPTIINIPSDGVVCTYIYEIHEANYDIVLFVEVNGGCEGSNVTPGFLQAILTVSCSASDSNCEAGSFVQIDWYTDFDPEDCQEVYNLPVISTISDPSCNCINFSEPVGDLLLYLNP